MAATVSAASSAHSGRPSGWFLIDAKSLMPTPAISPAATAPMPRSAPATAGWLENSAYITASVSTSSSGNSSMPASAARAPRRPK